MYLADYHTHSLCSPDGHDPMEALAEAALTAGMEEICFTDHLELVQWGTNRLRDDFDWSPMAEAYRQARAKLGERITMRLGVELGEAVMDFPLAERLMAKAPALDFIIGSVHSLSKKYDYTDLYFLQEADEAACREEIADYLEVALQLARWGQFHVLGHLTLPLRYMNENRGFHMTFDGFETEVAEVLRTLVQNGCGIELNVNRGGMPLPEEKWLRMYRELGGEIITLGTDAHETAHVGGAIREGQALLRRSGFTRFCTFSQGNPVWHAL